jgi:branched-subunit amino acid transport protein
MTLWLTMLAAGLVTLAIRWSFIGTAGAIVPPPWFVRLLRFVPIAALTALIAPDLVLAGDALSFAHPRFIAGMAAIAIAAASRDILATIGGGMCALWLAQYFLGIGA